MATALETMSDRDVVFIDTAGKRPGDEQHRDDILNIIQIAQPEDILLCIPVSTGFAAAKEVLDTYAFAGHYRLLITKLDETIYRGMILNLSWYTQKPLAYVTTGQNVPDDIELVDVEAVANQILDLKQSMEDMEI
jgi:flagellar biosynthesis protein FlhF